MTRRSSAASLALATTLTAGAAAPASAGHTVICAFSGAATMADGLFYPLLGPSTVTDIVALTGLGGTCVFVFTSGHIHGWCGNCSGSATVNDGTSDHTGSFTFVGTVGVFTGGIEGVVNMTPAPGESCLPGGPGADTFLLTGTVAFV